MRFVSHAAAIAWKDLRVELRSKEILATSIFFGAMIVIICAFSFVDVVRSPGELASGVLWIAVAFAGTLGLGRSFEREREGQTLRALLLSPAARGSIFLGKAVSVALFMMVVEVVVVPMVGILVGAPLHEPHLLALLVVEVTIGFAVVGSVFAGMLLRARAREVLLAVILYPVITPALIAGTKGTAALWAARPALSEAWFWIKFLGVFDLSFLIVSLWAFESLVVE